MKATNQIGFSISGFYVDGLMELLQEDFAPIHKRVTEYYWNNNVYGNVKRPYGYYDFDQGIREAYIPTVLNGENLMQFNRIVMSILPELDEEIYEGEIKRLLRPFTSPMGIIDSTTIFIVAPKCTEEHRRKVARLKRKAMLRTKRYGSTFVYPIISPIPEVAFRKIKAAIVRFWEHRIKKFLEKLKVQPYQYDYKFENIITNTIQVLERYNKQIINNLKSMVAHFLWFKKHLKIALQKIAELSLLKQKVFKTAEKIASILDVLPAEDREELVLKVIQFAEDHRLKAG
ncbi:hypothetical protein J7L97_02530 [Candidatus Bathyarchaeota archaeon]|nr:hypothetical protein [Candidatus Bathyarchaeota archaeon]